jgi:23S rRNA (guanosine2251-2'-O)-methyltransferase
MRKLRNNELNRLSVNGYKQAEKMPVTVVLDNVRSLYNIGSVFRSSDAFLVEKICLCGITAQPPHRDIHKTALGATETVSWEYYEHTLQAIEELRSADYTLVAIEQTDASIPLAGFKPLAHKKYALIFGHEIRGVDQDIIDRCDLSIDIPQFGTKHSLNISVSAGIVLWYLHSELSR